MRKKLYLLCCYDTINYKIKYHSNSENKIMDILSRNYMNPECYSIQLFKLGNDGRYHIQVSHWRKKGKVWVTHQN